MEIRLIYDAPVPFLSNGNSHSEDKLMTSRHDRTVFPNLFLHSGNPQNIFRILRNLSLCTSLLATKSWQRGPFSHLWWGGSVRILNTDLPQLSTTSNLNTNWPQNLQLLVHGNQARNDRCQTEIAAISRVIFRIFRSISKCLSSYSTIFRRTAKEVLRFRETLVEKNKDDDSATCVACCSVLHIQKADI
jgi:hypothetical protein